MTLTKEQRAAFEKAAKPLMKFMAENYHPHTQVLLHSTRAELVEGVACINTDEYLID